MTTPALDICRYSVITSSLATVGEIRRAKEHQTDKFALFGYGG
jgi:hypothetical protein